MLPSLSRRALFLFDPETAHRLSILALKTRLIAPERREDARLRMTVAGLDFPNPLGMAAGFDKNAEVPDPLLALGFGFVEVGSLTPHPQEGNPKPRIFRLENDRAVINRLGFNNDGHDAAMARLSARTGRPGIVGVNIGANKDSVDRTADYAEGIRRFHSVASYFTVNISSPNTHGLRNLQARDSLRDLLSKVFAARGKLANGASAIPVFLKIAPDLGEADLDDIAEEVAQHPLDGLVVSNTTLSRTGLRADPHETGGLSGTPLFERSTIVLAKMRQRVGSRLALIGVGGVDSAETMLAKIEAGADLVQMYTGLIYGGPGLPGRILDGVAQHLDRQGIASIAALRDRRTAEWAARPLPA